MTSGKYQFSTPCSSTHPSVVSYAEKANLGRSNVQDPATIQNEKGSCLRELKRYASPTYPKQTTKRQNFVPKDVILHKGKPFTYKPTDAKS